MISFMDKSFTHRKSNQLVFQTKRPVRAEIVRGIKCNEKTVPFTQLRDQLCQGSYQSTTVNLMDITKNIEEKVITIDSVQPTILGEVKPKAGVLVKDPQ